MNRWLPTPSEIYSIPELGILAALEAIVELCTSALVAAHPELQVYDGERPYSLVPLSQSCELARVLLVTTGSVTPAVQAYRSVRIDECTNRDAQDNDDFPF